MRQLHLFDIVLREVHLRANSPKKAFWRLKLVEKQGRYCLIKESGIYDKILDRRLWPMRNAKTAQKTFDRKVKEKLKRDRVSPRKYQITYCNN